MLGLKNKGKFCRLPTEKIYLMGSTLDQQNRVRLWQYDSLSLQTAVSQAREQIYLENHPVDSVYVKCKLDDPSLTPTAISFPSHQHDNLLPQTDFCAYRMHSQSDFKGLGLTCFPYFQ